MELDPGLTGTARAACERAGLNNVDVVTGDASISDAATGIAPVDVLVACGIFGNVSDDDIHGFVDLLPTLCSAPATVVWTRHRRPPDLTPTIRSWFAAAGGEEIEFVTPDPFGIIGVGAHRLTADPVPLVPGTRLFHFTGDGSAA